MPVLPRVDDDADPMGGGDHFPPNNQPQWVACGLTNKKNRHSNPTHDERDGL
jgi:hypothetical protein